MEQKNLLIVAMAAECRRMIQTSPQSASHLPPALWPAHLLWMCDRIEEHAENWPAIKVHRWIGYVQGGLIANRILRVDQLRRMFDVAKNSYGASGEDLDLVDHLNPASAFEIETGGEG
jgi:hypothetical protein